MSSPSATNKAGVIAGAVIGALLLLLLLLLLIWLLICCCHKRKYQKEVANEIRYIIRFQSWRGFSDIHEISMCLRRAWLVSSGRTPRPHRADPPAETPVSVQWWGTGPTPGCSTAPWGTTCPTPGRRVAVPSTQGGVTCPLLSGTNLLPSSMTMNTDTLCNYSQSAW